MTEFLNYQIVKASKLYELEVKVMDLMNRFWEPLGGLVVHEQGFLQAMILTRKAK